MLEGVGKCHGVAIEVVRFPFLLRPWLQPRGSIVIYTRVYFSRMINISLMSKNEVANSNIHYTLFSGTCGEC